MDSITGNIKNVTFRNEDNGYSILKINDVSNKNIVHTVVGNLPTFHPGENIEFLGQWIEHSKFGKQLKVNSWKILEPDGIKGIITYLSSGIFKGLGPKTAEKIVELWGERTLTVLGKDPSEISKIKGFSEKKAKQFKIDWEDNKASKEILLFLHQHDIASATALRIYKKLGSKTIEIIQENPYVLVDEIKYMGFKKSDEIAFKLGFSPDSAFRIKAGLQYTLNQSSSDGHVFLPQSELIIRTAKVLGLNQYSDETNTLIFCLDELKNTEIIKESNGNYYLPWLYQCEKVIASWVKTKCQQTHSKSLKGIRNTLNFIEDRKDPGSNDSTVIHYSEEQKEIISQAIKNKFFILTGGPGTGKTTTLKGILALMSELKIKPTLAAPTGRAARRMSEMCHQPALTIHRLLEYSPVENKFNYDEFNRLNVQHVIIDESSMVDTWLMSCLLKAMPADAALILIGDKEQLPSVGPGNVLRELLSSDDVSKGVLTQIYRQAEASDIVTNAHLINRGLPPKLLQKNDFININYSTQNQALEKVCQLCTEEIPKLFPDINPINDIQVLCPMKQGLLGNYNLNIELQKVLNPLNGGAKINNILFKKGDRIMQTQNDYEWSVFNGDIGFIQSINEEKKEVILNFETGVIRAKFMEMDSIVPAYSMTIHKSQGSEYPVVIIVLDQSHHVMLQRNLIYTAITRARKQVYLVANEAAIQRAVSNNKINKRYTDLANLISNGSEFMRFLED